MIQIARSMRCLTVLELVRSAGKDQMASSITSLRPEIYHPVCCTYNIEIMLHNHYSMPLSKKSIE